MMKSQEVELRLATYNDSLKSSIPIQVKMKIALFNGSPKKIQFIEPIKTVGERSINRPWSLCIIDQNNIRYCTPIVAISDSFKTEFLEKGTYKDFDIILDAEKLVNCNDFSPIDFSELKSLKITICYSDYFKLINITSNSILLELKK